MPDAAWKAFERWVAKQVGGQRRGAHTGSGAKNSGRNDVILKGFSIECKKLKDPGQADYYSALVQAIGAKEDALDIPIAFVAKKGSPYANAIAVLRVLDLVSIAHTSQPMDRNHCSHIVMMRAEDICQLLRVFQEKRVRVLDVRVSEVAS